MTWIKAATAEGATVLTSQGWAKVLQVVSYDDLPKVWLFLEGGGDTVVPGDWELLTA